jgi:hypothetical protein
MAAWRSCCGRETTCACLAHVVMVCAACLPIQTGKRTVELMLAAMNIPKPQRTADFSESGHLQTACWY